MNPFNDTKPVVGKASVGITQPITKVFGFVGDNFFTNYPRWTPEVTEFKPLDGTDMRIGAKAKQKRLEQGQEVETSFEVSEVSPPERFTLSGIETPFRNTYLMTAKDSKVTELEFSFEILELEIFMRPFAKLIRMAIEEGAENTVDNIKQLLHG